MIYTVDTLAALQSKMPDCSLTYLIGADTLRALGTWRRVETVIERCKFLVMMREGETREEVIRLAGLWAKPGRTDQTFWTRERWISDADPRIYGRGQPVLAAGCPKPWRIISARAVFTGQNQAWS
ncbi:MAG: nicotinate-nicotinamide nucleotide adenylyltransferase [Christensenellales bacterium]